MLSSAPNNYFDTMKTLKIRNFGPINEADIEMSRINLIIGMQSSGKSCVMMISCFCSWVEKRIALRQSPSEFENGTAFLDLMTSYYHSKGYVHPDTYIAYETDFMKFSYDHSSKAFMYSKKGHYWSYRRPKVSYVPAERIMISLVSNWSRLEIGYDNILDFKEDWDTARKYMKNEQNILGTGISYEYDEVAALDSIITPSGKKLELTNSSSGIQSLIPQFVLLDYLQRGIYNDEKFDNDKTLAKKQLNKNLLSVLYERNYNKKSIGSDLNAARVVHMEGQDYVFDNEKAAKRFIKEAGYLLKTDHAEIFLEEPESNLFPPTQFQLMDWILEMAKDKKHKNLFFIATHSPYILSHLLQENLKEFRLYLTYPADNGLYNVKMATDEEIQQIYDNGSDAFFNFDAIVE